MQTSHVTSYSLPFDIEIEVVSGEVSLESELSRAIPCPSDSPVEIARVVGVIEGVEQLLLSLARAGVDLSAPAFSEALQDCVGRMQG